MKTLEERKQGIETKARQRIDALQEKADKQGISEKKQERLNNRIQQIGERATNRLKRVEDMAERSKRFSIFNEEKEETPAPAVATTPANAVDGDATTSPANTMGVGTQENEQPIWEQVWGGTDEDTKTELARIIDEANPSQTGTGVPAETTSEGGVANTTQASPSVYVVRKGDTLGAIAKRYKTTVAEIVKANPGIKPNLIHVNQKINIPTGVATTNGGNPAPATPAGTPAPATSGGGGTDKAQTPPPTTPAGTTGGNGSGTGQTTPEGNIANLVDKYVKVSEDAKAQRAEIMRQYTETIGNARSAYQALVEQHIKDRAENATRRERDARSRALTNALGSLVNVVTAGALAKRGDYIPIVAEFNKEYDTDLRRSIEGRYALENENINLMHALQRERFAQEEASIQAATKAAIDSINSDEKVQSDIIKLLIEGENLKMKESLDLDSTLRAIEYKAQMDQKYPAPRTPRGGGGGGGGGQQRGGGTQSAKESLFKAYVASPKKKYGQSVDWTKAEWNIITAVMKNLPLKNMSDEAIAKAGAAVVATLMKGGATAATAMAAAKAAAGI